MNLFPTADDKRRMGESLLSFSVQNGMEWLESAAAQDAGKLDEYRAAVKEWEARKPRPRDFLPADDRAALEDREARENRRARDEVQAIWGPGFAE